MSARDTVWGYGWISIGLHWASAVIIVALWFIGDSINGPSGLEAGMLRAHTTVALGGYLLLLWRIVWRLRQGHPGPLPSQGRYSFLSGLGVHYALLAALAVMLASGPLVAWTGGLPLQLFNLQISSPLPPQPGAFRWLHALHVFGATTIIALVGLHTLGVLWHVIVKRDGLLDRIMAPPSQGSCGQAQLRPDDVEETQAVGMNLRRRRDRDRSPRRVRHAVVPLDQQR